MGAEVVTGAGAGAAPFTVGKSKPVIRVRAPSAARREAAENMAPA
jgi:hypothetical protein